MKMLVKSMYSRLNTGMDTYEKRSSKMKYMAVNQLSQVMKPTGRRLECTLLIKMLLGPSW